MSQDRDLFPNRSPSLISTDAPQVIETPSECVPRESGKDRHRDEMALAWLVAKRARVSAGTNHRFFRDETLRLET